MSSRTALAACRLRVCGRAVGFQVDEWRAVQAIEATHKQRRALDCDQFGDRGRDRVRPHRRTQGEAARRLSGMKRLLQHNVAPRAMHPVKHLDTPMTGQIGQRGAPAFVNQMEQIGPSGLPRLGHSPRTCLGVWMMPTKYTPASVCDGSTIATSPGRSSVSESSLFIT